MTACLPDLLNGTACSTYHSWAALWQNCMKKHAQAYKIKLFGDAWGCVLRPFSQQVHTHIHNFIMCLNQERIWFSKYLDEVMYPSALLTRNCLSYYPDSPQESIGRQRSSHKEIHDDPFRIHPLKIITNKNRPYHKSVSWAIRSARRPFGRQ